MLVFSPRRRVPLTRPGLRLHERRIARVNAFKYLDLIIDDHVSWRPAVQHTLFNCRRLLQIMYAVWCFLGQ